MSSSSSPTRARSVCKVGLGKPPPKGYAKLDSQAEASCVGELSMRHWGLRQLSHQPAQDLVGPDWKPLETAGVVDIWLEPFGWITANILAGSSCGLLIGQDVLDRDPDCAIQRSKFTWFGQQYPCHRWCLKHHAVEVNHVQVSEDLESVSADSGSVAALAEHVLSGHAKHFKGCASCMLARPRAARFQSRSREYWDTVLSSPPESHWSVDIFQHNAKVLHPKWTGFFFFLAVDKLSRRVVLSSLKRASPTSQLKKGDLKEFLDKLCVDHPVLSIELDQQFVAKATKLKSSASDSVQLIPRGTDQHAVLAERKVSSVRTLWDRNLGLPNERVSALQELPAPDGFLQYLTEVLNGCSSRALHGQSPAAVAADPTKYIQWMRTKVYPKLPLLDSYPPPPEVGKTVFFYDPRRQRWNTGTVYGLDPLARTVIILASDGKNKRTLCARDVVESDVFDCMDADEASLSDEWGDPDADDESEFIEVGALAAPNRELAEMLFSALRLLPKEISPGSPLSPMRALQWFQQASPNLRSAALLEVEAEMAAIQEKCTEMDKPADVRVVPMKWVLKLRDDGSLKARLCVAQVRPKSQKALTSHYASPLHHMVMRLVFASRPTSNCVWKVDFKKAFLQSDPLSESERDVFVSIPAGLQRPLQLVWRPDYPIYGLRAAPRKWQDTLRRKLLAMGAMEDTAGVYLWGESNPTLTTAPVVVMVHVDDSLVFANCKDKGLEFLKMYQTCFTVSSVEPMDDELIFLGQSMSRDGDCWTVTCCKELDLSDPSNIKSVRGQLNWLCMVSSPHLAAVAALYEPEMSSRVRKVQPGVVRIRPIQTSEVTLLVFCDASQGAKARRGVLYFLCDKGSTQGALVHWSSTSLECTVGSSTSELQALESATSQASRIHQYLSAHGLSIDVRIYSDCNVLLAQVKKGKPLAPPYQRYVPTIESRVQFMGARLYHCPGRLLPSDVQTKLDPSKDAVRSLQVLMDGSVPDCIHESRECI